MNMTIPPNDHLQFNPQIQVINLDKDGFIKKTDKNIFDWPKGTLIFDAHPFFEILRDFEETNFFEKKTVNFPCIHIEDSKIEKICDITFTLDKQEITIVLFDYTTKYKDLNQIAQQKISP